MKTTPRIAAVATLGLCATGLLAGSPRVADAQHKAGAPGKPMQNCMMMTGMQKQMHGRMQAMDAELDRLVAAMNKAKGSKKTDAIAAVLNRLVSQRKTQRNQMMGMEMGMMGHMMEHMQSGKDSLNQCPMMKGMMGMMGKDGMMHMPGMMGGDDPHSKHHP